MIDLELVYEVEKLLLMGKPLDLILDGLKAGDQDAKPPRVAQSDTAIRKAHAEVIRRWLEDGGTTDVGFARQLRTLRHLYDKSYKLNDFKTCLTVSVEIGKLQGKQKSAPATKPAPVAPKVAGRRTLYSKTMAERICQAISTSSKGLAHICNDDDRLPDPSTVYRWLIQHKTFRERYACARELQCQPIADQLITLADRDRICKKITRKSDGTTETVVLDQVERSKLQIDTRKWYLSKLLPKKYGEKLEVSGEDGGPIEISINRERLASKLLG